MPEPATTLRARLAAGETLLGTFLKLPALEAVDMVAAASFDFAVIDLEHAQLDEAEARRLLRHALALGVPAVVRIPTLETGQVNRLLEAGAAGLQLSTVRAVADAERLRAACHYPPLGRRSVSLAHPSADYGAAGFADYLAAQRANPPLLIGQFETAETDDPLTDLVAPFDVAFIGTTDLSVDLGVPGQLDHPRVRARIAEVAAAVRAAGKVLGGWVAAPSDLAALSRDGARFLVIGSDLQFLRSSLAATLRAAREAIQAAPSPAGALPRSPSPAGRERG